MYRNNDTLEQFQVQGRARLAADEAERRKVYDGAPEVERNYDFTQMGAAVVIDLDLVEGFFRRGPDRRQVLVKMVR